MQFKNRVEAGEELALPGLSDLILELLKSPIGVVALIAVVAGAYFFIKWAITDDEEQK